MKALIIGDQHFADRPPSSRTDSYRQDILDKAEWIIDYANDEDVDAVLNLGDVFHVKRQDRNSHSLVRSVAEVFGRSKAPVIIVPGNHDMTNDDIGSIPNQPLGVLDLHPNITVLMGPSEEFPVYSVPYVDISSPEPLEYWLDRYHSDGGSSKYPMIITHQSIFPEREGPIYEYVSAENWSNSFGSRWCAYGHIHSRMKAGAFYEIGGTWFCNNGAISRGSLHEETVRRKPEVTLFDSSLEGNPYVGVKVPVKPSSEVFKFEVVDMLKDRKMNVEAFLDSLGSSELQYLTIETIMEEAKSTGGLSAEARRELEDIIEKVTSDEK